MSVIRRTNNLLKWPALVATLGGAATTSFHIYSVNTLLFTIGSFLYLVWSLRIREWNLVIVNGVLLLIYLAGFIRG